MEGLNVCAWVTTALAVQQNRPSLVVVSDGPSSPLRAVDQVVCPRGTGWAFELSSHPGQLGQRAEVGAPTVPLPPGQLVPAARRKAIGVGQLLSMPGFQVFLQRSGTVDNILSETATDQSILEIASRTRESQRQQHVLPSLHQAEST